MIDSNSIWKDIEAIRKTAPLVHNITNYVVMNTTANALLSIGASPVMAHAIEEVEEMTNIAGALVINIGTLSGPWISSMEKAMLAAKAKGTPIVFDPVGAGATKLRTDTTRRLLDAASPSIIRGNASEIMALFTSAASTKGVDSLAESHAALEAARYLAREHDCVVSISGAVDYVLSDNDKIGIANGHPMMPKVTGMGCTATAITGAFAAVNADPLEAAAHAMAAMGICGELAAGESFGPGSLQLRFLDALYGLKKGDMDRLRIEK
jgi:hydroxyethylthiazole kinase